MTLNNALPTERGPVGSSSSRFRFSMRAALLQVLWFAVISYAASEFGVTNRDFWHALGMMLLAAGFVFSSGRWTICAIGLSGLTTLVWTCTQGPSWGQLAILISTSALAIAQRRLPRSVAGWGALACVLIGMTTMVAERNATLREIRALRLAHPIEDYSHRLRFAGKPVAPSNSETRDRWETLGEQWSGVCGSARVWSLEALHDDQYANFVSSPGFGMQRVIPTDVGAIVRLTMRDVAVGAAGETMRSWPPELVSPPAWWTGHSSETEVPDYWRYYPLAYSTSDTRFHYHFAAMQGFASETSIGYTPGKKMAAGFAPHGFHHPLPRCSWPTARRNEWGRRQSGPQRTKLSDSNWSAS